MSAQHILRLFVVGLATALVPIGSAFAQLGSPVDVLSVMVFPADPITPADAVQLDVLLGSGSSEIELFQPTEVQIIGHTIQVDFFAQSGKLATPDLLVETVPLGTLLPGSYAYEVVQRGPNLGQSTITGGFVVVPEPSSWILCVIGIAAFISQDRRKGAVRSVAAHG